MAINWNQAEFVSPKIQIAPEQLPLEAGMKVGATLQDRFDKSYENATKTGEAIRQMVNAANPIDRPVAEEVFGQYKSQLDEIAKSGKYHDMRWKTLKLAQEAANNYMSIAERNKQIQAQEEMISKDPRWSLKREAALEDFRKGLSSIGYNNENRTFSNVPISPYAAAADVDKIKYYSTYGKLMEPIVTSIKNKTTIPIDQDGNETTIDKAPFFKIITKQGQVSILSADKLYSTLKGVALADDNINAELERDMGRTGKTKDELFQEEHIPALKAVSKLLAQSKDITADAEEIKVNKNYGASGVGGFAPMVNSLDNMITSQDKVTIDKSYDNAIKGLEKIVYDDKGNVKALESATEAAKTNLFGDAKVLTSIIESTINPKEASKSFITSVVPPKFYDTLKQKGSSDKDIINAYQSHLKKMKKVVHTGYNLLSKSDQEQAMSAIMASTAGNTFKDENGNEVTGDALGDLKTGDIRFYPSLGKYAIVKNDKTYFPTVIQPDVEELMKVSAEIFDDFTNLNSDANIVNFRGRLITIKKDEIRPDGTYKGRVGEVTAVLDAQGKPTGAYKKITDPITFDTKTEGLTPAVIQNKIDYLTGVSKNMLGVE